MAAARFGAATVSCTMNGLSMGRSLKARRRIIPLSPMPPTVAANRSSPGSARRSDPSAPMTSSHSSRRPKLPAPWWFLPCTSQAAMPPTVTNLVPGVTGGNQPRGAKVATTSASSTPASQASSPVPSSKARKRFSLPVRSTPSGFSAASP